MSEEAAPSQASWEHFPHGADIGVRGSAPTLAGAFEQAALALTAIVADPSGLQAVEAVAITCESPDRELLLADWLNTLIYEMATRRLVFGRFQVHLDGQSLKATAWGEPFGDERELAVEPKGATYTALAVLEEPGGDWLAQCVIDV